MNHDTPHDEGQLGVGKTCFVITPIGSRLAPIGTAERARYEESIQMWESVFEPACQVFNLPALRADGISEPGELPEQIFRLLRSADVVIADLSGGNSNVMYELGLRHTRNLITIQVGEYERLPFDVNTIRTIQFRRTEAGLVEARNQLIDSLRAGLLGKGTPVTATQVWLDAKSLSPEDITLGTATEEIADVDEPGTLEMLADAEASVYAVTETLSEAGTYIAAVGQKSESAAARITASDAAGKGFKGRLLITRDLADELTTPTAAFEARAESFLRHIRNMDSLVDYVIQRALEGAERGEEICDFCRTVLGLVDSSETAATSMVSFRKGAQALRTFSKDLAPASKSLERSTGRILEGIEIISGWRTGLDEVLALAVAGS